MKNKDGVFLAVNHAWEHFTGIQGPAVIGKTSIEIFGEEIAGRLLRQDQEVMHSMRPLRVEESFVTERGTVWFDTLITPLLNSKGQVTGTVGIAREITERKMMEEQFLRTQRIESIGSLASGIAHDLNNILGPILMSASMLQESLPGQTSQELINIIHEAAQRGADIVSQVLTFARGAKGHRKQLDPRLLIRQVERILRETLPKSITFKTSVAEGLWNIIGDTTQLYQVFINLCVNARDAMPNGGTLIVSVDNCEMDKCAVAQIPEARPGRYVRIVTTDTGSGIPDIIREKIFDPFFTTKDLGKGTGLGLSTVLGIVKSHGGFVTLASEVGCGSQFSVYFPAAEKKQAAEKQASPSALPGGQGELILIVDDELPICKMAGTILKKKGYRVLTASGGKEALQLYRTHSRDINVVLTDLAMPSMDGLELIQSLKEITPGVTVIASTGQSSEQRYKDLVPTKADWMLPKPYTAQQLLDVIHQAVNPTKAGARQEA